MRAERDMFSVDNHAMSQNKKYARGGIFGYLKGFVGFLCPTTRKFGASRSDIDCENSLFRFT